MKDKDFDDIGKRLYDLEADPPKNGWKKVGSAINTSGTSAKVVWLRKNWWKPLVILIPLSTYFLYSVQQSDVPKLPYTESSPVEKSSETKNNPTVNDALPAEDQSEEVKVAGGPGDNASSPDNGLRSPNITSKDRNAQSLAPPQISSIDDKEEGFKIIDSIETDAQYNARHRQDSDESTNDAAISKRDKDRGIDSKEEKSKVVAQVISDDGILKAEKNISTEYDASTAVLLPAHEGTHDQSGNQQMSSPSSGETPGVKVSPPIDTANSQAAAIASPVGKTTDVDSTTITEAMNEKTEKIHGKWRVTLSFAPQYVSKSVRPVDDDVLVTGIDRSRDKHKIGLSFAAGAGFSITDNFYVDAQFSYAEAQQNIFFSYATGNVDTLIATQQPDQSVLVTPVYETAHREIFAKYGFAGIRLGATHYFWSTARRRFNISAMAGAHYLVSADVKEKRNGNWVTLTNDDLNKLNYTITVGAGYNINLTRGWELMINPALTYYLRKVKNSELPYDTNQQSLGINFVLSKTLSRK